MQKGVNHIDCVVHKCFRVVIPRPTEETNEEWLGTLVNIGEQVTFEVEVCDFTGSVPYFRGRLIRYANILYQSGWMREQSEWLQDTLWKEHGFLPLEPT
jgi:hypothetical protein